MNTLRDLRIQPIWVNPQHLVSTAAHILAGHRVRALGVLDESVLVGTISVLEVLRAPEGATVGQVMRSPEPRVNLGDSVRSVAAMFADGELEYAPVVDGDRFVGIVTPNMLLKEMGRSFDPMSGLSWSDRLREWGTSHLEQGDEVTILFIDLNEFGQYNKKHGHIVGDRVIRLVAERLGACIDPARDVLVRYGGDEFAIGTTRLREDAEVLAELLRKRASGVAVEEGVEPVTFSVGVFGGRRSRERENTHYAATLDNLINMASRAALAAKAAAKQGQAVPVAEGAGTDETPTRFRVVGVYADDQGPRPVTTVILGLRDTIVSGAAPQNGLTQLEAVSLATVKAMERSNPDVSLKLETLAVEAGVLKLKGRVTRGDESIRVDVARRVGADPLVAVAEATVEAISGR